jgi:hypothetical protein
MARQAMTAGSTPATPAPHAGAAGLLRRWMPQEEPVIRLAAGGAQLTARAAPVTDPARVGETLDKFRAKYGAGDVAAYYPKQDAAVEVPLT